MVCRVWSKNLENEKALARVGSQRHRKKKDSLVGQDYEHLIKGDTCPSNTLDQSFVSCSRLLQANLKCPRLSSAISPLKFYFDFVYYFIYHPHIIQGCHCAWLEGAGDTGGVDSHILSPWTWKRERSVSRFRRYTPVVNLPVPSEQEDVWVSQPVWESLAVSSHQPVAHTSCEHGTAQGLTEGGQCP